MSAKYQKLYYDLLYSVLTLKSNEKKHSEMLLSSQLITRIGHSKRA